MSYSVVIKFSRGALPPQLPLPPRGRAETLIAHEYDQVRLTEICGSDIVAAETDDFFMLSCISLY